MLASIFAREVGWPLRSVMSMLSFLEDQFVDLADGKTAKMRLWRTLTRRVPSALDNVAQQSEALVLRPGDACDIDPGHICADALAVADPADCYVAHVLYVRVHGDHAARQLIVQRLVWNAMHDARSRGAIS